MDELIQKLMSGAGVDEGQAKGGAGAILGQAKERMSSGDFSTLTSKVPGLEGLISEAPSGSGGGGGGGIMGAVSGMASGLGGGGSGGGGLGSLASLGGAFSSLGMDPSKISQFVPLILSFVQDKGGNDARNMLEGALK